MLSEEEEDRSMKLKNPETEQVMYKNLIHDESNILNQ